MSFFLLSYMSWNESETGVARTEIIAFSDRAREFEELNTQLVAASTDTPEVRCAQRSAYTRHLCTVQGKWHAPYLGERLQNCLPFFCAIQTDGSVPAAAAGSMSANSWVVWQVHLAWIRTPRSKGGLGHMQIPILADVTKVRHRRHACSLITFSCPLLCQRKETIHCRNGGAIARTYMKQIPQPAVKLWV